MAAQNRGILSIYWGDERKLPFDRLKNSVRNFHPELPHEIVKLDADPGDTRSLLKKAAMLELSPFEETLFLDLDTVVMGKLDFGFEKANQYGLALSICENPWAKRYPKIFTGDEIEYNTGVMFFTRKAREVFQRWQALAPETDSVSSFVNPEGNPASMPANDQGSFALAVKETGFNPFVLPLNWNFRPSYQRTFFGPIRVWHDYSDPPGYIQEINDYYEKKDSIIQFHYWT